MTEIPESVREAYRELPADWRLEKLKFFADVRNSNVDKNISEDEKPVRLCNYTDVYYNDRITPDLNFMEGSATEAEIERYRLKGSQVIITKDSEGWDDIGVPALITEDMPEVLCGYHLSVFEPGPELNGGFLAWLCRAEPLNDQFKVAANGVTRFGLGQYPMKNAYIALPPLETQGRIMQFLDEKTARIDELIGNKRALLGRLGEERQALITRAVTKGLDPDAPMKPSGIDWIGDIPAHWEIKRLGHVSEILLGLTYSPGDVVDESNGIFVIRASNIQNGKLTKGDDVFVNVDVSDSIVNRLGDIVVCSRNGSRKLIGKNAVVTEEWAGCTFGAFMTTIRTVLSDWVRWVLASTLFEFQSGRYMSTTINQLTTSTLKSFPIPVPPKRDADKIADELDRRCSSIDAQTELIAQSVERLAEYRAALITAAVTGQLVELR